MFPSPLRPHRADLSDTEPSIISATPHPADFSAMGRACTDLDLLHLAPCTLQFWDPQPRELSLLLLGFSSAHRHPLPCSQGIELAATMNEVARSFPSVTNVQITFHRNKMLPNNKLSVLRRHDARHDMHGTGGSPNTSRDRRGTCSIVESSTICGQMRGRCGVNQGGTWCLGSSFQEDGSALRDGQRAFSRISALLQPFTLAPPCSCCM